MKTAALALMVIVCLSSQGCLSDTFKHEAKSVVATSAAEPALKPVAIIESNVGTTARTGALIKFSAPNSVGEALKFVVDMSGVQVPKNVDDEVMKQNAEALRDQGATVFLPTEDEKLFEMAGDSVFCASYVGTIRATLVVASNTDNGLEIDTAQYVVVVRAEGSPPKPPEPPSPPDPPPVPPEGFGLGTQVQTWLATVPAGSRGEAAEIAKVFRQMADNAGDGKFRTLDEMNTATSAALKSVLKNPAAWGGFGAAFAGAINGLVTSGKISTPADQSKAYREIAGAM